METTTLSPPAAESVPGFVTTASGARQHVCPPDVPRYDSDWFTERERYLFAKGWEKEDFVTGLPTYRDPKASRLKGEYRVVGELPVKGDDLNKTQIVQQYHVPPSSYSFTLEEALDIQRRRDAIGDVGPSLQDRLGTCETKCNELSRDLEQLRGRIRSLLTANQLTFEGLKLGLRELIGA